MVPRPRTNARKGWPDNLYPNRDGFKYRHPVTRKEHYMGKDKAKAFAAAKRLNALLEVGSDLVGRVIRPRETVGDAIDIFLRDDVPARKWADKTAENYMSVINRIRKGAGEVQGLGEIPCAELSVKTCATFIRDVTDSPRSRQQFRLVLGWILDAAIQEGWMEANPATMTRRFDAPRKRSRLTLEQFEAIWDVASPFLRNAMDLSLVTLLRRDDVVSARFADVHDGALWIMPGKTEHSTGVRLQIKISPALADVLARCRDNIASPYLIHRLPRRARPTHLRAKDRDHHTQVLPEQLSREFADARAAAGITTPAGMDPPSFHEIRSLGGALLHKQGWSIEAIQSLMGHSAASMTEHYLDGHLQPWQQIDVALSLPTRRSIG